MPNQINSFTDLNVWKVSHELIFDIYIVTRGFPKEKIYGITSQIRRPLSSVATNVAEGKGRRTTKDYIHFLINVRRGQMKKQSIS